MSAEFLIFADPLGTVPLTEVNQPEHEMFMFKTITVYFKWTGESAIWPAPGNSHIKLTTNMGNENLFFAIRPNIIYTLRCTQPVGECQLYFDLGECDMAKTDWDNLRTYENE